MKRIKITIYDVFLIMCFLIILFAPQVNFVLFYEKYEKNGNINNICEVSNICNIVIYHWPYYIDQRDSLVHICISIFVLSNLVINKITGKVRGDKMSGKNSDYKKNDNLKTLIIKIFMVLFLLSGTYGICSWIVAYLKSGLGYMYFILPLSYLFFVFGIIFREEYIYRKYIRTLGNEREE